MAIANEFLTSNSQIAYPFRENAASLIRDMKALGYNALLPVDFFVDGLLNLPADMFGPTDDVSPLTVRLAEIVVTATTATLRFKDQAAATVFEAEIGLVALAAADYYYRVEDAYTAAAGEVHGQFVLNAPIAAAYLLAAPALTTYSDLPLESALVEPREPHVLSFALYNNGVTQPPDVTGQPEGRIDGHVKVVAGYNMGLLYEDTQDVADSSDIELIAAAGLGAGQVPCVEGDNTIIHPFMELRPDSTGNILLVPGGEGCYTIVPHPALSTFEIQGNCDACCTCDDFAAVLKALQELGDRVVTVNCELSGTREIYQDGVTIWNNYVAENRTQPSLIVNGLKSPPVGLHELGNPNWARVVIDLANNWPVSARVTAFTLTWVDPDTTPDIMEMNWEARGKGGRISDINSPATWAPALPRRSGVGITVLVRFERSVYDANPAYKAVVTAELTSIEPVPKVETVTTTVEFT